MPRGVKTCPDCKSKWGPRLRICRKCNHDFKKKPVKTEPIPIGTGSILKKCDWCKKPFYTNHPGKIYCVVNCPEIRLRAL